MSKSQPFQINWLAAAGSALGAVSSAVLLSTLGAAGTLFGAALGSLIITVGGSVYTQSLQKTTARVTSKRRMVSSGHGAVEEQNERVGPKSPPEPPRETKEKSSKQLPWKRIIGVSVGLFVVAMAIILAFELSTGRPVSSFTGGVNNTETGTTFSDLGSSSVDVDDPEAEEPTAEPTSNEEPARDEPKKAEPEEAKPFEDKPVEDKPVEEKPLEEKPADPPPAADPEE